ncbi:hypothetical protein [Thioalkalivibrio sp. ALJT]|uniref:hypothetical protein n=1 Tax=Thioalkalivibrio sp. ALJT TaxID=1158146 RepID=UPI0012DD4CD3|nr:hypothetical protein [Thioalkalivibrio sp. ALJT]
MISNPEHDLGIFIDQMIELLKEVDRGGLLLFSINFRENFRRTFEEVCSLLDKNKKHEQLQHPDEFPEMHAAGLTGNQLYLKLESFESSLMDLELNGGIDNLEQTLDKGSVILGSLAGAIPGFGSFAQELIDFILKEIRKRAKFWRRSK